MAGAQGLHGRLPKWVGAGPGRGLHAAAEGDGQVRCLAVTWRRADPVRQVPGDEEVYEEQEVAQGGGAMAEGSAGRPGALLGNHLHQVLRRPGATLGNHFNFYMNDFIIFIKHYYGRAHCSATTSSSSSSSSTRTTTASPPRRRVAREEALRGGVSRTSTRTRRTSTRTTRTTRGLRSARRGPSQGCEELVCCSIFTGFSRCRPGGGLTAWGSRHDSYGLRRRLLRWATLRHRQSSRWRPRVRSGKPPRRTTQDTTSS